MQSTPLGEEAERYDSSVGDDDVLVQERQQEISANSVLVEAISQLPKSVCEPDSYVLTDIANGSDIQARDVLPVAHRVRTSTFSPVLGPVPNPALSVAIGSWLSSKSLSPSALADGEALTVAAGLKPARTLRRRLQAFTHRAPFLGLPAEDVPNESDLRLSRCWPRVLNAVAIAAAKTDPLAWESACAGHSSPLPTSSWVDSTLDEAWDGDDLCRCVLQAHNDRECTVLVAGSQGAGKSATINQLLCRHALPHSHALTFWPTTPSTHLEAEQLRKYRHIGAVLWPYCPLEMDMPYPSFEVSRTYVKLGGKLLAFVELPSMETQLEFADEVGIRHERCLGDFEDIVADLQHDRPNYVLLVERMDDISEKRLGRIIRRLHRLYGRNVLQRTIVILTHGQALPPEEMSYDVWKFDCLRVVREVLRRAAGGRGTRDIPIVVFENSEKCRKNLSNGQSMLPDGTQFLPQFLEAFRSLATMVSASAALTPIPSKRWWENYVLACGVAFLVNKLA